MSQTQLRTPFLEGGIRSTNFFNGRLLSGEDMTTEHAAIIERECRLGRAVGNGVAYGLDVQLKRSGAGDSPGNTIPVLTVTAGLAINRCGQPVKLVQPVDVALVRSPATVGASTPPQPFSCCQPLTTGGRRSGDGVYLLTIAPASAREGRAAVNGLSTDSAKCNSKYLVAGVQFNLIPIGEPFLTADDFSSTKLPLLRNRIAYKCFGVDELASYLRSSFGTNLQKYGVVDSLLSGGTLTKSEVPLALAYWTSSNGVEFLDRWAVRRRMTPTPADANRAVLTAPRRTIEGEAMFLQFQEHLQDSMANFVQFEVRQRFRFLPPAGLLPLANNRWPIGFDYLQFFKNVTQANPVFIEGDKLGPFIRLSFTHQPVDLTTGEMIWLYQVRQNQQGVDQGGATVPQPFLLFANGHMPYQADARFDLAYWNYSNFI